MPDAPGGACPSTKRDAAYAESSMDAVCAAQHRPGRVRLSAHRDGSGGRPRSMERHARTGPSARRAWNAAHAGGGESGERERRRRHTAHDILSAVSAARGELLARPQQVAPPPPPTNLAPSIFIRSHPQIFPTLCSVCPYCAAVFWSDRFYLKRVKNVWTMPFTTSMIAGDNWEPQGVLKWGVDVLKNLLWPGPIRGLTTSSSQFEFSKCSCSCSPGES